MYCVRFLRFAIGRARLTRQYHFNPIHDGRGRHSGLHGRRGLCAHEPVADHPYDVQPTRCRVGPQERAARVHLTIVDSGYVRAQLIALGLVPVRAGGATGHRGHLHQRFLQRTGHGTVETHRSPACKA